LRGGADGEPSDAVIGLSSVIGRRVKSLTYRPFFSFSFGVPTLLPLLHKTDGARGSVLAVNIGVPAFETFIC